jgi:DNA excision repair protein ERCC-6
MNELEKAKVENESSRVAQRAAQAVLQSRMQRSGDSIAVPTWTGRSGAAGAPVAVRRRFGSTPNARVLSSSSTSQDSSGSGIGGLSQAGAGIAGSSAGSMSSREVLARLRDRAGIGTGIETTPDYERSQLRDTEPENLARQLRMFLQQNGNSVSSTLIVSHFKERIPTSKLPLFRQLLKEIAVLKREGAEAKWVLKDTHRSSDVEE